MKIGTAKFAFAALTIGMGAATIVASSGAMAWPQGSPKTQGELTREEKTRLHSKLHNGSGKGKSLRQRAATEPREIVTSRVTVHDYYIGNRYEPSAAYPHSYLRRLARLSDAVVVGTLKAKRSHLTQDETFIFSDHELDVEEILKENPSAPIDLRSVVTVTRPGGTLKLNGKLVRAIEGRYDPFRRGRRYILFLRFIPATGSYQAFGDWSFELVQSGPRKGAHVLAPQSPLKNLDSTKDPNAFVTEVRIAVADTR